MITERACFTEQPEELLYMPLPNGGADVWLRKNPNKVTPVNEDGEPTAHWEVDEAYMRFDTDPPTEVSVKSDFATWYDTATAWQPEQPAPPSKETLEERVVSLKSENNMLRDQLNTVMDVVDFILMEG